MKQGHSRYLPFLTFLGDEIVLNGLALLLYLDGHLIVHIDDKSWLLFLVILNLSWLAIVAITNPYRVNRVYPLAKLVADTSRSVVQHFFITSTAIFLLNFRLVHTWGIFVVYLAFLAIILVWRISLNFFLSVYRSKGYNFRRVAVIGYGAVSKHLEVFFTLRPEYGYKFVGYFDDNSTTPNSIGSISELTSQLQEGTIDLDEVYCCLPYVRYGQIKQIIDLCEDRLVKVKLITDFRAFTFKGLELERYDHIPVLNVSTIPLDNRNNQLMKRGFDILFSSLVIVLVFSWLVPIIALAIKLDSKGPVFFKQRRTGKNNEDFLCLKFRTMFINKDSDTKQATRNDSRITGVGRFLRKTSLDELPQFFNVLQGAMSVVGPRPHMLRHTEEYSRLVKKFMARHNVKPGITGLAQSLGYRGETKNLIDMKNRVRLDHFYIENWSFLLDIRIIIATLISLAKNDQKAF